MMFCCFKQKTAYEMRISDWSSDVCSSDLRLAGHLAMDLDHWDQAIEHFERVRRRIGGRDVVVLRELARAWAAKGDDARALLLIDRAYRLQPLNAGIMEFYAALLDRSGKAQAAAEIGRAHV